MNTPQGQLSDLLIATNRTACIDRAKVIAQSTGQLKFRDLALSLSEVKDIAAILKDSEAITSISFSYNRLMGNEGAIAMAKGLPDTITEIGLVGCGIGDLGGSAILNWAKSLKHLRMICIEQNSFSEELKYEFKAFSNDHPEILVVY